MKTYFKLYPTVGLLKMFILRQV